MPEYKAYELRGGNKPVVVEPLVEPGEGTHFAPEGHAWNPVVVSEGGGGGNPNWEEFIDGTVANPWGNLSYQQLANDIYDGNATAKLSAPSVGYSVILQAAPYGDLFVIYGSGAVFAEPEGSVVLEFAAEMQYGAEGQISVVYVYQDGAAMNATETFEPVETLLRIVHHPMPDDPK